MQFSVQIIKINIVGLMYELISFDAVELIEHIHYCLRAYLAP